MPKNFCKQKKVGNNLQGLNFCKINILMEKQQCTILEDNIEPDNLYLLDEPEVSLSPQNQVKLAEEINIKWQGI